MLGKVAERRVQTARMKTEEPVMGIFPHRQADDLCGYFGELCPVRREQRTAADVCNEFCIEQRSTKGDGAKQVRRKEK